MASRAAKLRYAPLAFHPERDRQIDLARSVARAVASLGAAVAEIVERDLLGFDEVAEIEAHWLAEAAVEEVSRG